MASEPRKRPDPELTPSKNASVAQIAAEIWARLYTKPEKDDELTKAHDAASDQLQVLMTNLRKIRDDGRPALRERKETEDVLKNSVGMSLGDLQTAFVQLPISINEDGSVILNEKGEPALSERVNLPALNKFSTLENHPFHKPTMAFLQANGVRFITREKTKGSKGKDKTVFEKVPATESETDSTEA